jgi:hypothetical protein
VQKMRLSILLFLLTIMFKISSAQQKSLAGSWQFHSINNLGLLEGQTGSSFQIQSVNGAQYKSWFAGIGLGLDYYRYRTIPLFVDFRKEFGRSSNKLFVYIDLGISFSWVTDQQKMNYVTYDKFSNGFYSDLGLGYKINVGRSNSLLLSLGYSYKKITETYNLPFIYTGFPEPEDQIQKINYSLNRLSIKMGWVF